LYERCGDVVQASVMVFAVVLLCRRVRIRASLPAEISFCTYAIDAVRHATNSALFVLLTAF
jgi:hypothetical protein